MLGLTVPQSPKHHPRRALLLLATFVCAVCIVFEEARAQPSEADIATARKLGEQAFVALDARDFAKAAELFARAEALYHAPTLLVGLARAQTGLGRMVEAQESYRRVLREPLPPGANDAFRQAVADASAEIGAVERQIAWVTIDLEGPAGAQVLVDGQELPRAAIGVGRALNPGPHRIVARAPGCKTSEQPIQVEPGAQRRVALRLEADGAGVAGPAASSTGARSDAGQPDAAPAGSDDVGDGVRTAGYVSMAVGGAGLVMGIITGILAMDAHSELATACPADRCPQSERDTLERFELLDPLSTVGFVAGGALAAAGLVMVLAAPSGESAAAGPAAPGDAVAIRLRVNPSAVTAAISF
jgi:hypothetical protein